MKDLIIGASTNYDWNKLKYWINSINKSGFDGEKVLILFNCDKETIAKVIDSDFKVIGIKEDEFRNLKHETHMPIHVERFAHIYNHLQQEEYRFVITTDVKDVIFQKNPIEYLEKLSNRKLVFSSESILYKNEPWGDKNLLDTYGPHLHKIFREKEIYNVGVLAGRGYAMRDLAINIFTACINKPIPICDQSTFNFLVSMSPYTETSYYTKSEYAWACQLGTTADPSKLESFKPHLLEQTPKLVGDEITTSTGVPYYIVHQYDRVPEWRKIIEEKSG
jgi:hypothetical protein